MCVPSLFSTFQNIIKKVIGQKFVYKFVSFPDILKMDPQAVEMGRDGGGAMLQEAESLGPEGEDEDSSKLPLSALRNSACRNDYIHSGLYSSFTVSSLRNQQHLLRAIKVEKQRTERDEEARTVIRFVANRSEKSGALPVVSLPSSPPASSSSEAFFTSKASPSPRPSASCSPSPSCSPAYAAGRARSPEVETDDSEQCAQPLNLSAGHRDRVSNPPEKRSSGGGNPAKTKKPKGLELSAPSLLLSASDIGSIALNSPALPSGSLTPAFFTAQVSLKHASLASH